MRRVPVLAVATILFSSTATQAAPRPPGFPQAEQVFNFGLNPRDRISAQILLIAAGFQSSVPTDQLQTSTFSATQDFQASVGLPPTGQLDPITIARLDNNTASLFQQWSFVEFPHPSRGRPIWMPQGMGIFPNPNKNGLSFRDPDEEN